MFTAHKEKSDIKIIHVENINCVVHVAVASFQKCLCSSINVSIELTVLLKQLFCSQMTK